MRSSLKRVLSWALVLAMILAMAPAILAAAPLTERNTGVRHNTCTSLSEQAVAYYTGNYTWDNLATLEGDSSGSSLEATDSALYQTLHKLMADTQTDSITYKSLTTYWPYTDTQPGFDDATLFYSDADGSGYNREHVWPKSRASFYQSGGGADLHHLRPTNSTINSTRSNYTMGNVREVCREYSTKDYNGETVLWYSAADDLVEVKDNVKGDVARILLYIYVRWGQPNLFENVSAGDLPPFDSDDNANNGLKVIDNLATLLGWCQEDPVDDWEMARNDLAQKVQGNRNVFIDYPELAWLLFSQPLPEDMKTPSGEAGDPEPPAYPITALSNNAQWGTVTLNGSRILASPAEAYYTAGAEVQPVGAATVTQNGNLFVITNVTEACTITVQFAPKTAANITYAVPDGVSVVNGTTSGWVGDRITLPQVSGKPADSSRSYSFVGWVDAPVEATSDYDSLTVYSPGKSYELSQAETKLYALYSYREENGTGEANTYSLVNGDLTDWSGDYVMSGEVTTSDAEYVHLATGESVGQAGAAILLQQTGMTKRDNVLTDVTDRYVISISRLANGNYAMRLKGSAQDCYLFYSGSGNTLGSATSTSEAGAQWQFSYDSSKGTVAVANVGTEGRYLQFNPSSPLFRCYKGSQNDVRLYAAAGATTTFYLTLSESSEPCPDGHTEEFRNQKDATCTETGYTGDTYCSVCGRLLAAGTVIPALGHDWSDWTRETPAGCETQGKEIRTCSRCDATDSRSIPATGHKEELRNQKDATCIEEGYTGDAYCSVCGELLQAGQVIPKAEHKFESTVVPPTCEKAGYTQHTCKICGTNYRDTFIPALGHDYQAVVTAPTCTEEGYTTYTCTRGDDSYVADRVPALGHAWGDWTVTQPADCRSEGEEARTCPVCQETQTRVIPANQDACPSKQFVDVNEKLWYHEGVDYVLQTGLMIGTSERTFSPNGPLTRGQLMVILYRLAGSPAAEAKAPFTDVQAGTYYADAVAWAYEAGIAKGVSQTRFAPNQGVSREQLVTFFARYTAWTGNVVEAVGDLRGFEDADRVSAYAQEAMTWAVENGLIEGTGENLLAPGHGSTRAQAATILLRYCTVLEFTPAE